MNCEKFTDSFILDFLRSQAPPSAASEFEEHVQTCPDCQARAEELTRLLAGMGRFAAATDVSPAETMKADLMKQAAALLARKEQPAQGPRVIAVFRTVARYAAAAAVLLVVWWVMDAMHGSRPTENVVAATISDIEGPLRIERAPDNQATTENHIHDGDRIVAGSQPAAFTYDRGYRIRLDANSALAVCGGPNVFRLERGGMRADGCECGREMRVITSTGTVRCAGGEFTLKVEPDGRARFAVHRGDAGVCCSGCGNKWRKLQAGESMTFSQTGWQCGEDGGTNDRGCGCGR